MCLCCFISGIPGTLQYNSASPEGGSGGSNAFEITNKGVNVTHFVENIPGLFMLLAALVVYVWRSEIEWAYTDNLVLPSTAVFLYSVFSLVKKNVVALLLLLLVRLICLLKALQEKTFWMAIKQDWPVLRSSYSFHSLQSIQKQATVIKMQNGFQVQMVYSFHRHCWLSLVLRVEPLSINDPPDVCKPSVSKHWRKLQEVIPIRVSDLIFSLSTTWFTWKRCCSISSGCLMVLWLAAWHSS